ncbi:hypothetical protein [Emcibacter nanhaiensis]|uniref:Uncharacterized protein n=1 Tax=Emcibacter nanhaiensis TaxID=1505037 RepID=A0A501PBL6_9PROT|nr:hypothetical protein [Emcibacter nanhaiensis]TPD57799.1 hypothetical protein FIV46_16990 [Emcibacter nanhaiensis]
MAALLVLGADFLRMLEIRQVGLLTVGELWGLLSGNSLMAMEDGISSGRFPGIWQDVMLPLLAIPAAIFFIVVGALMLFGFRRRYLR